MINNKIDISIIIPFLNEEDNVINLSTKLNDFFNNKSNLHYELILVDDGSTDNSIAALQQQSFIVPTKIIKLSQNYGSHAALRAGIQIAKGNYITFVYADLQDPLELITQMYIECEIGKNDIVWAVRKETGTKGFEKAFSKWYAGLMQKFVSKKFPERGFDVVMFNKKIAAILNNNIEANSSIFLQILTLGFKQTIIKYNKQERKAGKSKWTIAKKIKLLIDSFVAFSFAPIRFVSVVGIAFFCLGMLWTFYVIGRKILFNDLEQGWPALTSILLLGFGITNIALGIIAEYLWRTLDASRKRPVFVIDDIIEIKK